ncbi:hypothetical protein Fmac_005372 [Flemingia macrophylla]|uniref:Uncharacterized protein n=1 Tax=Flemingia macrophylla TaxID=520843 RepID=A0ABD1N8L0_9FABA
MVGSNGKKRWSLKRVKKEWWKCKYLWSAFKSKTLSLPVSFFNHLTFKLLSAFEAVLLLLTACFFYLFCGCSF